MVFPIVAIDKVETINPDIWAEEIAWLKAQQTEKAVA